MRRYRATITKYGEKRVVKFTLYVLTLVDFAVRLKKYGWKIVIVEKLEVSRG